MESNSHNRSMQRRRRKGIQRLAVLVLCAAVFFAAGWEIKSQLTPSAAQLLAQGSLSSSARTMGLKSHLDQETVDVLGGSMAHGWLDPKLDSYLKRALASRSASTNTTYKYMDHTIVAETPYMLQTQTKGKYESWLKQDQPQVVVISWGLLNAMTSRHKIPLDKFLSSVHQEIAEALKAHAVVLIVTPPVTQESATYDHAKQEQWINALFQEAASFHSINVYTIDLYHQMEAYLQAHGQTYKDYRGNSWHPNEAGHILAGSLLANDLVQMFGLGPISWR